MSRATTHQLTLARTRHRSMQQTQPVWTWSPERTTGFWLRMQTIEAAVHRWDAENAIGAGQPIDAELAADAVGQTFQVMAPARRAWRQAPQIGRASCRERV